MTESKDAITNAVLLTLFPALCRLGEYLERHLDGEISLIHKGDPLELQELLQTTLVATSATPNSEPVPFPTGNRPNSEGSQSDIVDLAIEKTCPTSRSWHIKSENILAVGYTNPRRNSSHRPENYFINTLESFVRSAVWELLRKRIGDAAMLYLLTNTSIFAALPNNCYCQITGPAISDQDVSNRPLRRNLLATLSSKKRPASPSPPVVEVAAAVASEPSMPSVSSSAPSTLATTALLNTSNGRANKKRKSDKRVPLPTIVFKRSKLFYFKRYHNESTMLSHFLLNNYVSEKFKSQPMSSTSILEAQMRRMFPKQYGLDSAIVKCDESSSLSSNSSWSSNSTISDPWLLDSKVRKTWRLRRMRTLVESMLQLNRKCKFRFLLQHYCPVKAIDGPFNIADTSVPELLNCYSSFDEVTSFAHSIVKKIIPLEMFGTVENRIVILRAMTRFIRLRKFETISLQYAIQGFKTSDCPWLQDERLRHPDHRVSHVPPSASEKQQEILNEFIFWLFDGFLIPLLQAGFYVTDSAFQRNKVFYYRHEVWHRVTKPAENAIQNNMFVKMEQDEIANCARIYAKVRLLPKSQDLRPIINLRRKSAKLVNGNTSRGTKPMNQQLSNAFLVLAYERNRQSQPASSAIGMSDLYQRFKQVKTRLVGPSQPNLPKLYMVKVDIKKSFDSVNQDKLLEIIDRIMKEDKYLIHRYSKMMPSNGKITKKFLPKAIASSEMPPFLDFARNQAGTSKHAVMIDKVVHRYEDKSAILSLIKDHINENIVKFGKHFYRQTTGIPQGSILSPALCRFFYDDMERGALSELTQSEDSELLRLADDFLFVSRSRDKAASFLNIMSQGHADYGCFINEKKTITNFEITMNGEAVQMCQGNEFPYCGLLLHTKTLEIRVDYSRYHGEDIRDLLTVGRDLHPGRSITYRMKKAMQHMCQMAFSDTTHNSLPTVMLNVHQTFIFCAMKFHAYCQELHLDPVSSHYIQPTALPSVVMGIFRACYGLLHNSRRSTVGVSAGAKFDVAERHVHWLGASAFCKVLPALPVYGPLLTMLRENVLDPLDRNEKLHFKRMLHSAVKDERNKIMDMIRYT